MRPSHSRGRWFDPGIARHDFRRLKHAVAASRIQAVRLWNDDEIGISDGKYRVAIRCRRVDPLRVDRPLELLGLLALHLYRAVPAFRIDGTPWSEVEAGDIFGLAVRMPC